MLALASRKLLEPHGGWKFGVGYKLVGVLKEEVTASSNAGQWYLLAWYILSTYHIPIQNPSRACEAAYKRTRNDTQNPRPLSHKKRENTNKKS